MPMSLGSLRILVRIPPGVLRAWRCKVVRIWQLISYGLSEVRAGLRQS